MPKTGPNLPQHVLILHISQSLVVTLTQKQWKYGPFVSFLVKHRQVVTLTAKVQIVNRKIHSSMYDVPYMVYVVSEIVCPWYPCYISSAQSTYEMSVSQFDRVSEYSLSRDKLWCVRNTVDDSYSAFWFSLKSDNSWKVKCWLDKEATETVTC